LVEGKDDKQYGIEISAREVFDLIDEFVGDSLLYPTVNLEIQGVYFVKTG